MTSFPAQLITWINVPVNAFGRFVFGFIAVMPGWLSNTIISAVAGVVLLVIFKYTSNQRAIGAARDDIKAHLLALKLFKDSISVTLRAQGRVFRGAFLLLFYSVRPMLVMIVPVVLLLSQLALWYEARPLLPGEQALVTMKLPPGTSQGWPDVTLEPDDSFEVVTGPVRVFDKREIIWKLKALQAGIHELDFQVRDKSLGDETVQKQLVAGEGFVPVSVKRPGRQWSDILLNPLEKPFGPDSQVSFITIDYPDRPGLTCGTDWWVIYFFIVSMVFALIVKPLLKVRI